MGRSPCCDKNGQKKGPWTTEEDAKLVQYIQIHGPGNWRTLPKNAGLQRCGKSCRLRWTNYLRPDIKRGRFSFDEEETIIQLHSILGNKWSAIAARLPGRTDNEIKNYWNTHIRKRLLRMGIDPITHGPRLDIFDLSSILASSSSSSTLPPQIDNLSISTLVHLQQTLLLNPHALRLALTMLTSSKSQTDREEEIMLLQKLKRGAADSQHFLQHQSQPPLFLQQLQQEPNQFENLVNFQASASFNDHHHHQEISGSIRPIGVQSDGGGDDGGGIPGENSSLSSWKVSSESGFSGESLLSFEIPEGLDLDEFIM